MAILLMQLTFFSVADEIHMVDQAVEEVTSWYSSRSDILL